MKRRNSRGRKSIRRGKKRSSRTQKITIARGGIRL